MVFTPGWFCENLKTLLTLCICFFTFFPVDDHISIILLHVILNCAIQFPSYSLSVGETTLTSFAESWDRAAFRPIDVQEGESHILFETAPLPHILNSGVSFEYQLVQILL